MERTIQASNSIEDGLHKGVIVGLHERETKEKYEYIDVEIEFEKGKKIKASYADFLSPESKLGMLLIRFGCDLNKTGVSVKMEEILLKKTCQFLTAKKGKYSNVVLETLRPPEAQIEEIVV